MPWEQLAAERTPFRRGGHTPTARVVDCPHGCRAPWIGVAPSAGVRRALLSSPESWSQTSPRPAGSPTLPLRPASPRPTCPPSTKETPSFWRSLEILGSNLLPIAGASVPPSQEPLSPYSVGLSALCSLPPKSRPVCPLTAPIKAMLLQSGKLGLRETVRGGMGSPALPGPKSFVLLAAPRGSVSDTWTPSGQRACDPVGGAAHPKACLDAGDGIRPWRTGTV